MYAPVVPFETVATVLPKVLRFCAVTTFAAFPPTESYTIPEISGRGSHVDGPAVPGRATPLVIPPALQ